MATIVEVEGIVASPLATRAIIDIPTARGTPSLALEAEIVAWIIDPSPSTVLDALIMEKHSEVTTTASATVSLTFASQAITVTRKASLPYLVEVASF